MYQNGFLLLAVGPRVAWTHCVWCGRFRSASRSRGEFSSTSEAGAAWRVSFTLAARGVHQSTSPKNQRVISLPAAALYALGIDFERTKKARGVNQQMKRAFLMVTAIL